MRAGRRSVLALLAAGVGAAGAPAAEPSPGAAASAVHGPPLFVTADRCLACHNGLATPSGEDVSIGATWRASMMANAARDPYWQAAVRREILDHPEAAGAIENECAACHMPMPRFEAKAAGATEGVFVHLPVGRGGARADLLAADGVSCTVCHQIEDANFGTEESYTAGFLIDARTAPGGRPIFGPYAVDAGRQRIMRSATEFVPAAGAHVQRSGLCATCHTLYTHALGPGSEAAGSFPEQVPYLEWRESAYRGERSCQSCHLPTAEEATPIASVLGEPREGFSRHLFRGGNFFTLRMLDRYRDELGVTALPEELQATAGRTLDNLQRRSSRITLERAVLAGGRLEADVVVESLAGHKLPTAYPSRRVWLHVTVRDAAGRPIFESGAPGSGGWIEGNDNDADAGRYEPHYEVIDDPAQVQIYESILADPAGAVTTGLLTAVAYAKDNRLLPRGFDKTAAGPDVAVHGRAAEDPDFEGGGDRVRYSVEVGGAALPLSLEAELLYQPIAYRWAENLRPYGAPETDRFVAYYASMAGDSSVVLARATATVR